MSSGLLSKLQEFQKRLREALIGPQTIAFLPAVILGGYWFGGEGVLLFLALVFPGAFAIAGLYSNTGPAWAGARDRDTDLKLRGAAERAINETLAAQNNTGTTTAAIAIGLDDFSNVERQFGARSSAKLLKQVAERLCYVLRENDIIVRLDGPRFAVALGPVRRVDLETLIQLSARLQAAISEPISIDATRIFLSASVGFCLASRAPENSGSSLLESAETALDTAGANGNGSIRAYSSEIKRRSQNQTKLQGEIAAALEAGQITPWFQPQVSTNTGEITGFEALARWEHPENGTILPADFLPALISQGLQERLCEIVLSRALSALRHWDKSNMNIPSVAVNFSSDELSNPKICEKVKWELDRYELRPDQLCVEILEDVIVVSQDEVIARNIQALAELGCKIDLDDFGTGHASIANIRRFAVHRIKIDRSFVTRVDRDREQQNMVAAILTLAERLGVDTLAEGVETIGEHAILAQIGCGHVQGFSVAKPMPFEKTESWISAHRSKLPSTPDMGRKIG